MAEYINREELLKDIKDTVVFSTRNGVSAELRGAHKIADRIRSAPACDVVEVVRCKDCVHFISNNLKYCDKHIDCWGSSEIYVDDDDFCSFGERNSDNLVKPTEQLTEEQNKHIAEMLNEKHGNLSIESTIGFFEFIDMWKENLGILLKQVPEAEFVRVVRCKDCKFSEICGQNCFCEYEPLETRSVSPIGFCSYGERKSDDG